MLSSEESVVAVAVAAVADAPPVEFTVHFMTGVHVLIVALPSITIAALKRMIQQQAGTFFLFGLEDRVVPHSN